MKNSDFLSENFQFSIYLNRRVFVMIHVCSVKYTLDRIIVFTQVLKYPGKPIN